MIKKKLLLLLLLLFSLYLMPCIVWSGGWYYSAPAAGGGSYPGFDYDVHEDFEDALSGNWSETDPGGHLDPNDAAANYRGTYGMSFNWNNTDTAYIEYGTFAPEESSASIGFWFYVPDLDDWDYGPAIAQFGYQSTSAIMEVYFRRESAGASYIKIKGSALETTYVEVNENTWYWITAQAVQNDTGSVAVYNTSGAQVGSTLTTTCMDDTIEYIRLRAVGESKDVDSYWDEFFLDITDATFPLGPPSGS